MISPCKDCSERSEACHDHCEKFREWKAQLEEAKARERKESENSFMGLERSRRRRFLREKYGRGS